MRTQFTTTLLAALATAGMLMASPAIASADMPVYQDFNKTAPPPSGSSQLFGSSAGISSGVVSSFANTAWIRSQYAAGKPVYEALGVEPTCYSVTPETKRKRSVAGCGPTDELPQPITYLDEVITKREVPLYYLHYKKVTTQEQLNSATPKYVVVSVGPTEPLPDDFWTQANRPTERVGMRWGYRLQQSAEQTPMSPYPWYVLDHISRNVGVVLGGAFDQPGAAGIFLVRPNLGSYDEGFGGVEPNYDWRTTFDAYGRN